MLIAALAMAGGGAYLLDRPADGEIGDLDAFARTLGERQGLVIGFGDPKSFFVPPYLAADAEVQGVTFDPADRGMIDASLKGIAKAFDAYPEKCLGRIIKAVFIAGKILINGTEVGGTYGQDWIFVASPRNMPAETRQLVAELDVHHETSSFIWWRNPALQTAFKAQEPVGWSFQNDAAAQVARGQGADPAIETGFLSAYGATTSENDFNTYAEIIFSDPARMKDLAKKVPLIAKKVGLVLAAYIAIDPRLNETFSRTGLLEAASRS
jgi:hypothetical protein